MGGRLDATNIADECIGIITNVDLEHTQYLGNKIEKIAYEKAGILKNGIGITAAEGAALQIIKEHAAERNITLKTLNEDFFAQIIEANDKHTLFNFIGCEFYNNLEVKLLGRYQVTNAALAVAAAEELGVEEGAIRQGLKKATNPGRMQILSRNPLVVIDAAHNPHGIKELVANLDIFNYEKLICVFGVMKDKNWKEMLRILAPQCDLLIANQTKTQEDRAANAEEVAREALKYTKAVAINDVKKSFAYAKKEAKRNDMILVCGSIYMLGELL
jgi:dihydrofolate synthase/folylpolyglutamate synthase